MGTDSLMKSQPPHSALQDRIAPGLEATARRKPDRRLLVGFLAVAILPYFLLIDTLVAFARGWETRSRLDFTFIALAAFAAVLVSLALVLRRGRAFFRRNGLQLALLTAVSVACWLVVERVAAARVRPKTPFHLMQPGTQQVLHPDPVAVPGIFGESRFTVNSIRVRGPELPPRPDAYRILCIGGSTTECLYLDDSETWPQLVMDRLNREPGRPVWVGNAGVSGPSTVYHLKFLQESDLVPQTDCVVLLAGVNDLVRYLRTDSKLGDDTQLDVWAIAAERFERTRPLWRRSRLLDLARQEYQVRSVEPITIEDRAGINMEERRRQCRQTPLCDRLPDLGPGLQRYRQRLRAVVETCRARGVRLVFLTQPILWDKGLSEDALALLWIDRFTSQAAETYAPEKLREAMDRYNEVLREVCHELDVECIDLASMNGQEPFFYDDAHFTEAGAREVARLVADGLRKRPRD